MRAYYAPSRYSVPYVESLKVRNDFSYECTDASEIQSAILNKGFRLADTLTEIFNHVDIFLSRFVLFTQKKVST